MGTKAAQDVSETRISVVPTRIRTPDRAALVTVSPTLPRLKYSGLKEIKNLISKE
jgi:type IV secretory pathway VirB10-like protein